MTFPFNAQQGAILINAELEGPNGIVLLQLALDTGATMTVVNAGMLLRAGYDPALATAHLNVATASGIGTAPLLAVDRLRALGQERRLFPVLGHTLPPSTGLDGLLGLDFLRGLTLTIDFRQAQVTLI